MSRPWSPVISGTRSGGRSASRCRGSATAPSPMPTCGRQRTSRGTGRVVVPAGVGQLGRHHRRPRSGRDRVGAVVAGGSSAGHAPPCPRAHDRRDRPLRRARRHRARVHPRRRGAAPDLRQPRARRCNVAGGTIAVAWRRRRERSHRNEACRRDRRVAPVGPKYGERRWATRSRSRRRTGPRGA